MMKVLQLGPVPPPEGGVARNLSSIRDELVGRGHECFVIATTKGRTSTGETTVLRPRSAMGLIRALRSIKSDVTHLHIGGEISQRILGLCFAVATFGFGRKVLTIHSGGFPQSDLARGASARSWAGVIFRRFDKIICVNEEIAAVIRKFGIAESRIAIVSPFAMPTVKSDLELPELIARFRAEHSPLLVAVGGLESVYDPLLTIAALEVLAVDFPNAGLVIVGDGPMLREVEEARAGSICAERILLTRDLDHAVALRLVSEADVMLRPTRFDGDATSVREALSLGTRVVASDVVVRPAGVTLTKPGDRDSLADAVKTALRSDNPVVSPDKGAANIVRIVEIYESLL